MNDDKLIQAVARIYRERSVLDTTKAKEIIALVRKSEWISVDTSPENNRECRVSLGGYEQTPFYKYSDSDWLVQVDNGAWKKSNFIPDYWKRLTLPPIPTKRKGE